MGAGRACHQGKALIESETQEMKKVPTSSKGTSSVGAIRTVEQKRLPASKAFCWVCPEEQIKIASFRLWIVHRRGQPVIKGSWQSIAQGYPG